LALIHQFGSGNTARLHQGGWMQEASIVQGSPSCLAKGNQAAIYQLYGSGNVASILQRGAGNNAVISQHISGGIASVEQLGNHNRASLTQKVAGAAAEIIQNGDHNVANLVHDLPLPITVRQAGSEILTSVTVTKFYGTP
jgi:minor curlin subunit